MQVSSTATACVKLINEATLTENCQEKKIMFRTANYQQNPCCLRCGKTVYPTDKIGKINS